MQKCRHHSLELSLLLIPANTQTADNEALLFDLRIINVYPLHVALKASLLISGGLAIISLSVQINTHAFTNARS